MRPPPLPESNNNEDNLGPLKKSCLPMFSKRKENNIDPDIEPLDDFVIVEVREQQGIQTTKMLLYLSFLRSI